MPPKSDMKDKIW